MLGLPASTEIRKVITKKKVYEHFGAEMSTERRKSFDSDIARITLVNEVSPASVNIAGGEAVHSFFVVLVSLRNKEYDKQNIAFIAKMFGQKLLLLLEYEGQHAVHHLARLEHDARIEQPSAENDDRGGADEKYEQAEGRVENVERRAEIEPGLPAEERRREAPRLFGDVAARRAAALRAGADIGRELRGE